MGVFMGPMSCTLEYMLLVSLVAVPLASCPEFTVDHAVSFNRGLLCGRFLTGRTPSATKPTGSMHSHARH